MVIVMVLVQKIILFFHNTEFSGIVINFPTRKGAVKYGILPINRKDHFSVKVFTKDGEVARRISVAYMTVIVGTVFVMMSRGMTVATDEVVGSVVTMVMRDAVEGVGDADLLQLHVVWLGGGEGVDVCAMHARQVDPEEHLLCDLQSG
jgi:hypothetical protein